MKKSKKVMYTFRSQHRYNFIHMYIMYEILNEIMNTYKIESIIWMQFHDSNSKGLAKWGI